MSLGKGLLLIVLLFIFAGATFAQSRGQIKRDIRDLSYRIERDVDDSEASNNRLRQAKRLLEDALSLVRDRGDGPSDPQVYQECLDYAYEKFRRSYNDSTALDKARVSCRPVADMDILKFLYEKHFRSLNSGSAMELSASQATRETRHKLPLLEFSYEKHFRNVNSTAAATKGVENIKMIELRRSGEALSCLKKYYDIYLRSMNSTAAMDKTAVTCSEFN